MWTVIMEVQYPLRHPFLLQLLPWQKIDAHLCRTAISFIDMQNNVTSMTPTISVQHHLRVLPLLLLLGHPVATHAADQWT